MVSSTTVAPPATRGLAVAVLGTLLIASTYGMARFGVGLFAPRLGAERPDLAPVAGWAAAAQFVAYALAAAVASRTSDRWPRTGVAIAGATAGLGCLGVATTSSAAWFVVLVFVGGTGAGLASPALVRLVDAVVGPSRAATAQSLVNTGTAVGVVVAGLLALTTPSIAAAWWAMAAVNAGASLGLVLLVRRVEPGTTTATETSYDPRALAGPALAALVVGAGSALIWSYGPLLATGTGAVGDDRVGLLWIALGIGGLLGPLTGRLVERRGIGGAWAVSVGAVVTANLLLGLGLTLGPAWSTYVAMACFGAGYMCLSGVLILAARRAWPDGAGRGTSLLFIALAVGQAAGAVGFDALQAAEPVISVVLAAAVCAAGLRLRPR
ncbi:MFS transporter [Nocardioides sp.]|uniref:MFS transporter n=1 Tax=Nocardioides sp. TaxID=35761 RepID=UPI0035B04D31